MYLYDYLFNYLFVCLFIYVFIYQWQPLLEQISIQTSAFLKKGQFFINPPQENSLHSPYLNISLFPSPKPGGEEGSWVMGQWENPSHIPKESTKPIKKKIWMSPELIYLNPASLFGFYEEFGQEKASGLECTTGTAKALSEIWILFRSQLRAQLILVSEKSPKKAPATSAPFSPQLWDKPGLEI